MRKLFEVLKFLLLLPWRLLTWIREILANLILLVIIVVVCFAVFSKEKPVAVPQKGALVIAPSGSLVEQITYMDPFRHLLEDENQPATETALHDLLVAIKQAQNDSNITALVIDPGWLERADPSKLLSLGAAIHEFKKSGKPVFAVGDSFTQAQYILASHADHIYLHPMGSVFLSGFGAYPNFFKDALDKLKINVHVFRVGDYKSFVEPFVRNDMSAESKQNSTLWLNDLWKQVTTTIEQERKLDAGAVDRYIASLDTNLVAVNGDSAQMALKAGLVDKVVTRDEMKRLIIAVAGQDKESGSFAAVDFDAYVDHARKASQGLGGKVGVIVASGNIMDGHQPAGSIGGDSLAKLIAQAREDDDIKALVLRIDSPGGSAFASEIIRDEIELTQKAGIPVIASFGGVAASGGYWIASTADEIWSTPTTITGSIGVFGMIPTFEQSLGAIGVHSDGVGTTVMADALHLDRPMNPIFERTLQLEVEHTYARFLELAAKGRKSTPETIHAVAQGQVWSGLKAKELGLVDHLGDLDQAIAAAAEKAKLGKAYRWEIIEPELSPKEQFIRELTSQTRSWLGQTQSSAVNPFDKLIAVIKQQMNELNVFNDPHGVYVRCLECRVR